MIDETTLAALARQLGQALMDYAYTRKDEDRKRVNDLQATLCSYIRREESERRDE